MLASVLACEHAPPPVRSNAGPATNVAATLPRDTARPLPPLGADSFPLPEYPDVPGWYVTYARSSEGLTTEFPPDTAATGANLQLYVHPPSKAWLRVARGRSLVLLLPNGEAEARIVSIDTVRPPRSGASYVTPIDVLLPSLAAGTKSLSALWLLPRHVDGAAALPVQAKTLGDSAMVWSADGFSVVLRRESTSAARLYARTANGTLVFLENVKADPAMDREMGVEPDSILRLNTDDPRIPGVNAVFRLGPAGPWIFLLVESGYECSNDFLIRMDSISTRFLNRDNRFSQCMV